jgi:hypothetical protein
MRVRIINQKNNWRRKDCVNKSNEEKKAWSTRPYISVKVYMFYVVSFWRKIYIKSCLYWGSITAIIVIRQLTISVACYLRFGKKRCSSPERLIRWSSFQRWSAFLGLFMITLSWNDFNKSFLKQFWSALLYSIVRIFVEVLTKEGREQKWVFHSNQLFSFKVKQHLHLFLL